MDYGSLSLASLFVAEGTLKRTPGRPKVMIKLKVFNPVFARNERLVAEAARSIVANPRSEVSPKVFPDHSILARSTLTIIISGKYPLPRRVVLYRNTATASQALEQHTRLSPLRKRRYANSKILALAISHKRLCVDAASC